MALFRGTNREFKRFIGPMLRNLVQQITKKYKKKVGACEHCGANKLLESAHRRGRDRNEIIDIVLESFTVNKVVTIDLNLFEERFREAHKPIQESILILCKQCHNKYDKVTAVVCGTSKTHGRKSRKNAFTKLDRISRWGKFPQQGNSKIVQTYMGMSNSNLGVNRDSFIEELKSRSVYSGHQDKIENNLRSMYSDNGNSHGCIFYDDGIFLVMYDIVYKECMKYFIIKHPQ